MPAQKRAAAAKRNWRWKGKHTMYLAAALAVCGVLWKVVVLDDVPTPHEMAKASAKSALRCTGTSEQQFARLQRDLRKAGANVANVELSNVDGLRGIKTTSFIAKGEIIVSIPHASSLSAATFKGRKKIGAATNTWPAVDDSDRMLDALALMYERFVLKGSSAWANYLCFLPGQYVIPMNYTTSRAKTLMHKLPLLYERALQQQDDLRGMSPHFAKALRALPGGRHALSMLTPSDLSKAQHWAFAATQTRSVTLSQANMSSIRVPKEMLSWLTHIDAMVPVLDMANHAAAGEASAIFAFTEIVLGQSKGGRARLGDPHFQLRATRDLQPGEEVTWDYWPDDQEQPRCADEWLLEYGFPVDDGLVSQGCFKFEITVEEVVKLQLIELDTARVVANNPDAGPEKRAALRGRRMEAEIVSTSEFKNMVNSAKERLQSAGQPALVSLTLWRDGRVPEHVGLWLKAAFFEEAASDAWAMVLSYHATMIRQVLQWSRSGELGPAGVNDEVRAVYRGQMAPADVGGLASEDEAWGLFPVLQGALKALETSLENIGGGAYNYNTAEQVDSFPRLARG